MKKKFDLNMHSARLLMGEPFFSAVSRRIDKVATTALPTAGVKVDDNGFFTLLYNPDFFATLEANEISDVLKHEFYHIIFEHVTGRLPGDKVTTLWNIATDLAINSHLRYLPEIACKPGEGEFKDLESGLSAEKYHKILKKMVKDQEKNGVGEGEAIAGMESFDDHGDWGSGTSSSPELAKERLKNILKDAAKEATQSGSWGSMPESVKRDILASISNTLDWRKVLRYFIKTSQKANKSTSVKKINRRYPYLHPGRKTNRQANIAISIDQSGSVDDQMLGAFFAELNKLAEFASFTVIPFDTEVDEELIFRWNKGKKYSHKRVLSGGTCFDAPTDYVNKGGYDGHIILTDMYAPKPKSSKCQRMWMTTPRYANNPYFETKERVVAISYDD
jgi:predicted metal-dependent peptidase